MLMVTKKTPVKKKSTTTRKPKTVKRSRAQKVDYYPNRMTLAISALAAVLLLLLGVIVSL